MRFAVSEVYCLDAVAQLAFALCSLFWLVNVSAIDYQPVRVLVPDFQDFQEAVFRDLGRCLAQGLAHSLLGQNMRSRSLDEDDRELPKLKVSVLKPAAYHQEEGSDPAKGPETVN